VQGIQSPFLSSELKQLSIEALLLVQSSLSTNVCTCLDCLPNDCPSSVSFSSLTNNTLTGWAQIIQIYLKLVSLQRQKDKEDGRRGWPASAASCLNASFQWGRWWVLGVAPHKQSPNEWPPSAHNIFGQQQFAVGQWHVDHGARSTFFLLRLHQTQHTRLLSQVPITLAITMSEISSISFISFRFEIYCYTSAVADQEFFIFSCQK